MSPLYTLDKLAALTSNNAEVMDRFNRSFLEQTIGTDLPRLVESARKQDYDAVFHAAHRMKTSVDVYSINSIREVLHALESNARTRQDLDHLPAQVRTVAEALMHVARDLRSKYINTPKSRIPPPPPP